MNPVPLVAQGDLDRGVDGRVACDVGEGVVHQSLHVLRATSDPDVGLEIGPYGAGGVIDAEIADGIGHDDVEGDRFEADVARLTDFGEEQQVRDQTVHAQYFAPHPLERAHPQVVVDVGALEHLAVAADHGEWGAQLVRGVADEPLHLSAGAPLVVEGSMQRTDHGDQRRAQLAQFGAPRLGGSLAGLLVASDASREGDEATDQADVATREGDSDGDAQEGRQESHQGHVLLERVCRVGDRPGRRRDDQEGTATRVLGAVAKAREVLGGPHRPQ